MSWDSIFGKKSKKEQQRENLERNIRSGKAAEDRYVFEETIKGNEVERTGRGSDFRVRTRDIYGRVTSSKLKEVKSSKTASVSKLQKKGVKKGRVSVVRYDNDGFGLW